MTSRVGWVALLGVLVVAGVGLTRKALAPKPTLWEAAALGDTALVEQWIERGKGVSEPGLTGYTPLHFACGPKGSAETVRFLLAHGADPNAVGPGEETPLMRAELWENEEVARVLREAGAK